MKAEVILLYTDRPILINNALRSIDSNRRNGGRFHISVIDDSTAKYGVIKHIMWKKYRELYKLSSFFEIKDTLEDKIKRGDSIFGKYATEAIRASESDFVIILCDDDALFPNYIKELSNYYQKNPSVLWSWCSVSIYDPSKHNWDIIKKTEKNVKNEFVHTDTFLNDKIGTINPCNRKDSSQVTFRVKNFNYFDISFLSQKTANLDAHLYNDINSKIGPTCHQNDIMGQFKGIYPDQLGNRQNSPAKFLPTTN